MDRKLSMTIHHAMIAFTFFAAGLLPAPPTQAAQTSPLNFVFILIDDLGWTDLSCYGSRYYETPNVDSLAAAGVKFTSAYAACTVCSPTRASILSGKYPARLRLTDWISGNNPGGTKLIRPAFTQFLALSEVTLAEAFKSAGYATAHMGKWHLGGSAYWPDKQGFDVNFGGTGQGQPPSYFDPYGLSTLPNRLAGEYLTDRLGEEAATFIEANKDNKFFLHLAHYAVHTPIQAKQPITDKYAAKTISDGQRDPAYAAMIESVDDTVGQVIRKLRELRLQDRTVVIFFSDNGGLGSKTSNYPLRAGKGTIYEGGTRVPLIVSWPGGAKGGVVNDTPVSSVDFYPTMLEMAGLSIPPGQVVDGVSLAPLLQGGSIQRDAIYWHYPHYHSRGAVPYGAIRQGDYKLILTYEDGALQLYNLAKDIGERTNLAMTLPKRALAMRDKLFQWLRSVNAQMPRPRSTWTGWSRADCDLWTLYHKNTLVPEADVKTVIKAYRLQ